MSVVITEKHRRAEAMFRNLLDDSGMPAPDEVRHYEDCVQFVWSEQHVSVRIDLGDVLVPGYTTEDMREFEPELEDGHAKQGDYS